MNVAGAGLPAGSSQTLALWTPRVAPATSHMPGLALPVPMRQSILVDAGKTCLARSCRGRAIRGGLQDSALPLCSMPGRGEGGSHSCLLSSGLSCQPPEGTLPFHPWWILQAPSQRAAPRPVRHGDLGVCAGSQAALHPWRSLRPRLLPTVLSTRGTGQAGSVAPLQSSCGLDRDSPGYAVQTSSPDLGFPTWQSGR